MNGWELLLGLGLVVAAGLLLLAIDAATRLVQRASRVRRRLRWGEDSR